MELSIEVAGWVGTLLILLAYFLVSTKKLTSEARTYQLMNLLGAIGVGINVLYKGAWPSFALQIAWGTVAIISLIRFKK